MFKLMRRVGIAIAVIFTTILMAIGLTAPAQAIHNGQKWCNSPSSDAAFIVWEHGIPNVPYTTVSPGACYTLRSGEYSPSNIRVGLYDTGSFRVRNNKTSGAYGAVQNTGSDREKEFRPGDSNRIDFLLYDRTNGRH